MKKNLLGKVLFTLFLLSSLYSCKSRVESSAVGESFTWDNATVYFVYIDRFFNGTSSNDENYNRKNDYGNETKNVATFHGGDIVGITQKLEEGYFQKLGVNVIWITGVYEQIHGWVGGGDKNDFPHYAYHGYYPMDFTAMDKNFGTIEEFRAFVDLAHTQGMRVVMDAGINHPGYLTLLDAVQYKFGGVDLTEDEAVMHYDGLNLEGKDSLEHYQIYSYLNHFDFEDSQNWMNWWGDSWIRSSEEVDKDVLTESIFGLPDFRTDSRKAVGLPQLMKNKWASEGDEFKKWVNPSAQKYRTDLDIAQSEYVIHWLAAWVEEFGIDGFRCDVLENVDTFRWVELNKACNEALSNWREKNPNIAGANWSDNFWMTGDIWDAGIDFNEEYAKAGFASIVNFTFPKDGNLLSIGTTWQNYSDNLNTREDWNTLSFLNNTYKRDTQNSDMMNCGTSLLLSPGAVQIFYGDEVGRKAVESNASDPTHGFRSDFVWGTNPEMLKHWRKLGQFRNNHHSVGAGIQTSIGENTFLREYDKNGHRDRVIIKLTEDELSVVELRDIYEEGTQLRNAYSGEIAKVEDGKVAFKSVNQVLLIEEVR
ncbi:alpha-amylase family glycosyl hydrolase [Sediminitomix flava]|uniref:Glycosidase n=1 Tax=Sediminitomix flava TaxID=379075 RepID=A0A315YXC7_SEDFL|nr:alpha-amylase family glycosyl hydrolase [Sediminitomix flava]PWJ34226.1 glycosidase [Sediminitomix flava]